MDRSNPSKKRKGRQIRLILPFAGLFAVFLVIAFSVAGRLSSTFCANSISCITDLSGNIDRQYTLGTFMGKDIPVPESLLTQGNGRPPVLGATSNPNKHIYVDLTNQKLYAFDGNSLVFTFPVSTGKWHYTPTGNFHIWIKLTATRMTGGSGANYYDLPNVPWTMFFANDKDVAKTDGYAIHGAYWNPPFGHPYSHGCVNLPISDAKQLYDWAEPITAGNSTYSTAENPGTLVTIFGTTPSN